VAHGNPQSVGVDHLNIQVVPFPAVIQSVSLQISSCDSKLYIYNSGQLPAVILPCFATWLNGAVPSGAASCIVVPAHKTSIQKHDSQRRN